MNISKDKLLDKLIKLFVRESESVDKSTIKYLAHRYTRYISGSNCVMCWDYSPCMCVVGKYTVGRQEGEGKPTKYTPAEKIAYEYQNYKEVI